MHLFKAIFICLVSGVVSQKFDLAYYLPKNWKYTLKHLKGLSQDSFNIHTLLKDLNYPIENHWITTEDGYVLQVHRISGRNQTYFTSSKKQNPAILLMHGLGGSSIDWVIWGPEKGLGLVLADAGYDVWLGNNRGNLWSRNHIRLNPDIDEEFWDYSFEKCGYYDLPATIDYILQKTGEQKLFYVGFSQGTSQFFAMAALRPEYNDKIALMSAMAPIAYMGHLSAPLLRLAATYVEALTKLTEQLHLYESSSNGFISELLRTLCANGSPIQDLCVTSMFINSGFDSHQLDTNLVPMYMYTSGAGMSYNMIKHYGQEIKSGHFRRYDYGSTKNLKLYGSKIPPNFNVSLITTPVDLYYGENDFLADVKDVKRLKNELPNAVEYLIPYRRWTHLDFNIARDVNEIINKKILARQQLYIDNGALTTITPATTTTEQSNNKAHYNCFKNNIYIYVIIYLFHILITCCR
ncbi:unnamed protein product [Diabrotica balteata]|uniref:AB hydrolase-1 domain-containing protein n=1 Tax=Diabrotica balteata TaxID=107213 RepID=A0A9N9SPI7_DIABA|nr:unnamed protein product [Diabrotica balteata]